MAERKVRLEKSKVKQGIDECIFELALTGKDMKDLQRQPLINAQGHTYGSVEAYKGKATINLNLPRFVRWNNIQPYSLTESIRVEIIRNDCETQLKKIFGNNMNTQISKIEVNITQPVSGNATQSDVLNLLSHATMSYEFDNVKYIGRNKQDMDSLKEESHTVITRRPHYWIGKFYDKSEQIIKERIEHNQPVGDVPPDLLRVEIILVDRILTKLFGNKKTLSDVLTTKNLLEILREYKRIFCEELVDGAIKPYLNACKSKLVDSLKMTNKPVQTIAKHRELIPDVKVLAKALREYMHDEEKADNSARDAKRYAEQYDLPVDCITTIRDFKRACG